MVDTPSQNMVDIPSRNTLNQNTPSPQHTVDTPSPQHTVDTPSPLHTVDTPSPPHTEDTPSRHQHTVDTVIMVINQSQHTSHTATITDHHMEATQDRRTDNLWATMAHPPTVHLPMAHHVILKATTVLPNKDRHSLKTKLVQKFDLMYF